MDRKMQNQAKGYKLCVQNLPEELQEDGIKELFASYGKVIEFFTRPNISWAYVTYAKYNEAESAVRDLHDKPPLDLKVFFTKQKGLSQNLTETLENEVSETNDNTCVPTNAKNNEDDSEWCAPDYYENANLYKSTNALWAREELTVTSDGKRHVSLGRGYTKYEIPDPHPETEKFITKQYEERNSGTYEHGVDNLKEGIGLCLFCSKPAKMRCQRCSEFYCNRDCQVSDWQKHKFDCQDIPNLVDATKFTSLSTSNNGHGGQSAASSPAERKPLRRPKTQGQSQNANIESPNIKNIGRNNSKQGSLENISNKLLVDCEKPALLKNSPVHENNIQEKNTKQTTDQNSNSHSKESINNFSKHNMKYFNKHNADQKSQTTDECNTAVKLNSTNNVFEIEESKITFQNTFLSKNQFTEVEIIVCDDNGEYWVQKVEDKGFLEQMMLDLNSTIASARIAKPVIDQCYAVQYEGIWHRGIVTSLDPIQVHYIDYGNTAPVDIQNFRELNKYKAVPALAKKIRLSQNAQKQCGKLEPENKLSVKMISVDRNGVTLVEVKGDNEEVNNEEVAKTLKSPSPRKTDDGKLTKVIDKRIELKSQSEVCITAYRTPNMLFVRPLDTKQVEYFHEIIQRVAKAAQTAPHLKKLPSVKDKVIGRYTDGNYYRAIVTKVENDKIGIAYVDFGNVEDTQLTNLFELPEDLKGLSPCTVKVHLKDVPQDVPPTPQARDYLDFLVGAEKPLKCIFTGSSLEEGVCLKTVDGESVNEKIAAALKPTWERDDYDGLTCYMIDDIDKIGLGSVGETVPAAVLHVIKSGSEYAMCPQDPDLLTHIFDIMPRLIEAFCKKETPYIPRKNELCLALFADEWYRAVCLHPGRPGTDTAIIYFLDYGNTDEVAHKNIRLMPKDFLTPQAFASRCTVVNLVPKDNKGQCSPKVLERIGELIVENKWVMAKIVKCDSNSYEIELPNVRDQLIKEKLISP